ncbi:MAG: DUF2202 domain-containing protein [Sulfurovum sp.]|nr:DUF2202 domain-containing protein [Sulfurovum sp.]
MNKSFLLAATLSTLLLAGCGSSTNEAGNNTASNGGNTTGFNLETYPASTELSQELKETIAYMGNEERLAYDVYMNLYNFHIDEGVEIKQLFNIANNSETQHIATVQNLVHRYNLDGTTLVDNPVADSSVTQAQMPSGRYGIPAIQEPTFSRKKINYKGLMLIGP